MPSASTATANLVRATLVESRNGLVVLAVPGTDYRLHLVPTRPIPAALVGKRVEGRIDAAARKINVTEKGGNFIDPVYGRPRNIQGRVVERGLDNQTLVVHAAVPLFVRVRHPQSPADFAAGQIVNFAVEPGATFTLAD